MFQLRYMHELKEKNCEKKSLEVPNSNLDGEKLIYGLNLLYFEIQ